MLSDFWLAFLFLVILNLIVILVIIIVRIGILAIKYVKWRKVAIPTVGTVGELINVTCNYDKTGKISSYRYNYALRVIHDNQEFDNTYTEECEPGILPITRPGQKINILWSASDHKYLNIDGFEGEIKRFSKQTVIFTVKVLLRTLRRGVIRNIGK